MEGVKDMTVLYSLAEQYEICDSTECIQIQIGFRKRATTRRKWQ